MSIPALLIQVAVSLLVVGLYHLWIIRRKQPSSEPLAVVPVPIAEQPKAPIAVDSIPPEILAVIAGAIAVVLDQPHRVVSVQPASVHMPEVNVWAMEGRMEQFMSHKIR